jgi:hypothetical protein
MAAFLAILLEGKECDMPISNREIFPMLRRLTALWSFILKMKYGLNRPIGIDELQRYRRIVSPIGQGDIPATVYLCNASPIARNPELDLEKVHNFGTDQQTE